MAAKRLKRKPKRRLRTDNARRDFPNRRPRIPRVDIAVEVTVESHCRAPRKNHAEDNATQRLKARHGTRLVIGEEKTDQSERQSKNRMAEFDERKIIFHIV